MRLPRFFGKLSKPRLFVRRVVGSSMSPKLVPGQLVLATNLFHRITAGEVYIFVHEGREKIKRIERITGDHIFFVGDNLDFSSDSRHFGWVEKDCIVAKVIWPRVHN